MMNGSIGGWINRLQNGGTDHGWSDKWAGGRMGIRGRMKVSGGGWMKRKVKNEDEEEEVSKRRGERRRTRNKQRQKEMAKAGMP